MFIVPNYGIAIILLTIVIKLLFIPLMNKQYGSMKAMQELNPELTKIKEKYKKDPQKMQKEIMGLYRQKGINPLQGCLPMIIQIPFFIAIYATILSDSFKALITEPGVNKGLFSFWISDLSLPDSTFILPILLAYFTYWSQKMIMVDPKQKMFLYMSPILILVFGLKLPGGVLLYWAVSTLVSTIQQTLVMKKNTTKKVEIIQKA